MYPFKVGDVVTLKKPHPCGGFDWKLIKNGIEVTIECTTCGRVTKLDRKEFNRRIKKIRGEVNEER